MKQIHGFTALLTAIINNAYDVFRVLLAKENLYKSKIEIQIITPLRPGATTTVTTGKDCLQLAIITGNMGMVREILEQPCAE
jgi:hypothetical protein